MKKVTYLGILTATLVFLFPFITSSKLFYASVNAKSFYIYGFTTLVGIMFAYLVFNKKIKIPKMKKNSFLVWVSIALITVYILASFFGVNSELSFFGNILRSTGTILLSFLFLLAFILSSLLNKDDWKIVGKSVIVSSVAFSIFYFIGANLFKKTGTFFSSPQFLFGNSTFAGTFLFFGVGLTLIGLVNSNYKNRDFWFLIGALLVQLFNPAILSAEIFSGLVKLNNPFSVLGDAQASSAVIFALIFYLIGRSLIIKLSSESKKKILLNIYYVFAGLIVVFLLGMLFTKDSYIQNKYIETSSSARIIVWDSTVDSIKDRPILGWGPENFDIAIQKYFNNDLFLRENLSEVWFDRAHNIFLDTMIEVGAVGTLVWFIFFGYLIRVFYLAYKKNLISENEAHFLIILIIANIIQLQTSFNTVTTYFYIFLLLGYGLYLEKELNLETKMISENTNKFIGILFLIFFIIFTPNVLIKERNRQHNMVEVFSNTKDRESKIDNILSKEADYESLRLLSASLMKGLLDQMGNNSLTEDGLRANVKELSVYEKAYEDYIYEFPDHYRARVNLSYIYMLQTILGNNKLDEAELVLKDSYELSPQNPLTYGLHSLTYLYRGNFKEAERLVGEGISMNPEIKFSQNVLKHINEQKESFPEITFLKIGNL